MDCGKGKLSPENFDGNGYRKKSIRNIAGNNSMRRGFKKECLKLLVIDRTGAYGKCVFKDRMGGVFLDIRGLNFSGIG
ncbi:hypothetical protein RF55_7112 [Lasius niger]|uniref:Uncharacterized protein n=1 Tax=Lasius niger TaxID=67767 RepID=A0A0J7KR79_LASNI|nr:hypothetical protein RF55_7112 [Lasius niger]